MKQTSLEWLENKWSNEKEWSWEKIQNWFEQAKEMHKQEIIDAYDKGEFDCGCNGTSEQYYNETFNK